MSSALQLVDMGEEEAAKYCKEKNTRSILPRIIKAGYKTLNLVHFFTVGPDEVRAWTIQVCFLFLLSYSQGVAQG